jgi:hypothetical protein
MPNRRLCWTRHVIVIILYLCIQRKIIFGRSFFLYTCTCSPCHYRRAWICVSVAMNAQRCGEKICTASLLQGSGLVRTVGQYAQRKVASGHRDAFSNKQHKVPCFSRGLLLARAKREPWSVLCHTCTSVPINILVQ